MRVWIDIDDCLLFHVGKANHCFTEEKTVDIDPKWLEGYLDVAKKFWDYQDTLDQLWSSAQRPTNRTRKPAPTKKKTARKK